MTVIGFRCVLICTIRLLHSDYPTIKGEEGSVFHSRYEMVDEIGRNGSLMEYVYKNGEAIDESVAKAIFRQSVDILLYVEVYKLWCRYDTNAALYGAGALVWNSLRHTIGFIQCRGLFILRIDWNGSIGAKEEIYFKKRNGIQIEFSHDSWTKMPKALDLVNKLTNYNPDDRISLIDVLKYPWLQEISPKSTTIKPFKSENVIQNVVAPMQGPEITQKSSVVKESVGWLRNITTLKKVKEPVTESESSKVKTKRSIEKESEIWDGKKKGLETNTVTTKRVRSWEGKEGVLVEERKDVKERGLETERITKKRPFEREEDCCDTKKRDKLGLDARNKLDGTALLEEEEDLFTLDEIERLLGKDE
ncbi:hypothetical protein HK098_007557 [Nowakowskiella sp. JEL0407]|nr:hypothetical protein HK098_007557 [Nowakowskiella sp. JEL0407]